MNYLIISCKVTGNYFLDHHPHTAFINACVAWNIFTMLKWDGALLRHKKLSASSTHSTALYLWSRSGTAQLIFVATFCNVTLEIFWGGGITCCNHHVLRSLHVTSSFNTIFFQICNIFWGHIMVLNISTTFCMCGQRRFSSLQVQLQGLCFPECVFCFHYRCNPKQHLVIAWVWRYTHAQVGSCARVPPSVATIATIYYTAASAPMLLSVYCFTDIVCLSAQGVTW